MEAKRLTKRLMALLLTVCLLLSGVSVMAEEEIRTVTEQGTAPGFNDDGTDDWDYAENDAITVTHGNGKLIVDAGDVEEGGASVSVVVNGEDSDILVTVGEEPVDTEGALDDQGAPEVESVQLNLGDVSGDEYGIGVNSYDYDDEQDVAVVVRAGDVDVTGEDGATGVIVYDFGGDVDVSTGDVDVDGGDGEGVGLDIKVSDDSQVGVTVDGDVSADGEGGAGIRVETMDEANADDSRVDIVVTGTVSGSDAAIQVTEDMAKKVDITAWTVEENEDGRLAQVLDADGEVDDDASGPLEEVIKYIVKVAEDFVDRLIVSASGKVTVGEGETYQTALENEEVEIQVTLGKNEVLKGIYYNDDAKTAAEYTRDGENLLVKMLRGGAMLLGLDIGTKTKPWPDPWIEPEDDDDDDDDDEQEHPSEPDYSDVDYPTAQRHAHDVNEKRYGGYQYVDILEKERLMNESELAQFNTLSLEDRMLLMMTAMGLDNTGGAFRDSMTQEAKTLAEAIDARVATMSEAEQAARRAEIDAYFQPRQITMDGVTFESVGIVLVIDTNGNKTYESHIFFDDNGIWKLHHVEEGRFVVWN